MLTVIQWYRSLRGKILLSLLLLIIAPVLFIVFSFYSSSRQIVETQLYFSNQTSVERKAAAMNELSVRILKASNLIMNDQETLKFLRDPSDWTNEYPAFYSYTTLINKMSNIRDLLLDNFAYLALYDYRGYIHTSWAGTSKLTYGTMHQEPWFDSTSKLAGSPNWMVPYKAQDEDGDPLLVMARVMNPARQGGDGMLWIGVPVSNYFYPVEELRRQAQSGVHMLLLDGDKPLLGDSAWTGGAKALSEAIRVDESGIRRVTIGKEDYLVNEADLTGPGWKLVQLVSSQAFASGLKQAKNKSTLLMLFWFSLFAVAFIGLMFRFTRPIIPLVRSMNRVGKGELNTTVEVRGNDEIAMLGRNFNKMVQQLQELVAHLSEEQQRKQKAQFQALQAQINPHFLTNTMNSIKWMAILSGATHVSEMLTKLGKLLNYTMQQKEEIVRLREELNYLQVYMALQEIRYHDNVTMTVDVPEALLDAEIVRFTLQPIVENSLIHGNRFPLHIEITAKLEEELLRLQISDNGVGMGEETIRSVEEKMNQPHAKFSGIGIRNVNERIKLEFGSRYGVSLGNREEGGVLATVTLPYRRRSENDAALVDCG
ncbi:cache domain-containing sensor histidine kinase [Paenibacillus cremeus]|nr:sensor histidine kinase [Paenibacillus cremeus]